ncbi:MAG: hypothetical protein EBS05_21540 [Proteobacteria bacterium]|nr:hypothetical protein [Pseudomonadota bacterium]
MKALSCLFAVAMFLLACGPAKREISGQVFITMRGGGTVKLGGVSVLLMDSEVASNRLATAKAACRAEIQADRAAFRKLQVKRTESEARIKALQTELAATISKNETNKTALDKLVADLDGRTAGMALVKKADREKAQAALDRFKLDVEAQRKLIEEGETQIKAFAAKIRQEQIDQPAKRDVERLEAESLEPRSLFSRFDRGQTGVIAATVADADGRYKLVGPAGRNLTVVAWGERELPTGKERYLWVVPATEETMLHSSNIVPDE